jgi:predicted phosphodiesterase
MRIFAISDLHVDYEDNAHWITSLSSSEFRNDVLIVAGDISDSLHLLEWTLKSLVARFRSVLFVPGNHDLWVVQDKEITSSLVKFEQVCSVAGAAGASMSAFHGNGLCILPLLGWYDYSFGQPTIALLRGWNDYRACRWPARYEVNDIAAYFDQKNLPPKMVDGDMVISFSHFLPRIDVMPDYIPVDKRVLYPVLGTTRLERRIRELKSNIHVYGHSHVNRRTDIDGVTYVNNAFGYPHETRIAAKQLACIHSV